jgi:3-dehydrotetronate 4-kinase
MLLGVIADDFTGASDIANTLSQGIRVGEGLRTAQYIGIPEEPAAPEVEAGVVALKIRSVEPGTAVQQSLDALKWLLDQGCHQIVFKYCSTFDSTATGNIGPIAEALARKLGVHGVVVSPAFPRAERTVYKGYLFVGNRLLNQSGMELHPLNPMTDSNLPRWLSRQCSEAVGLLDWESQTRGAACGG